jgi:sugar phosphate isomerase/epimerase
MIDRRSFLGNLAIGLAAAPAVAFAAASPQQRRLNRIGMQLYTVRDAMAKDVDGTLARVAAIGFKEVEFAGYFDKTPQQIKATLARLGLTTPSTHVAYTTIASGWQKVLDDSKATGHEFVVIPFLDEAVRKTIDDWKRIAAAFNTAAEASRKAGLKFAYHNHHFEFVPVGGRVPFDVLLEECDRGLVQFELDLCWTAVAGQDPLTLFQRYPGRFPMVHLKDLKRTPPRLPGETGMIPFERVFPDLADVGQGIIDWTRIFAQSAQAGTTHYFVEHDTPADAFASLTAGYKYLDALRY